MPGFWWADPNAPHNKYHAKDINDPDVPAGYVFISGSDGSLDRPFQTFKPYWSGGFPAYGSTDTGGTFTKTSNGIR